MRIEVDKTPIDKPLYASGVSDVEYMLCLTLAPSYNPTERFWDDKARKKVVSHLRDDPSYEQLVVRAIQAAGPYSGIFTSLTSLLTERLAQKGNILEIDDKRDPKETTDWRSEDQVWIGSLTKGTLAYKGGVYDLSGLNGGTVFVDGPVKTIQGCESGVIYVRGDVEKLYNVNDTLVIVDGHIKSFSREDRPLPVLSFPNIISSDRTRFSPKGVEVRPVIVSEEEIRGWNPRETKKKAVELSQRLLEERLTKVMEMVGDIRSYESLRAFNSPLRSLLKSYYRSGEEAAAPTPLYP